MKPLYWTWVVIALTACVTALFGNGYTALDACYDSGAFVGTIIYHYLLWVKSRNEKVETE